MITVTDSAQQHIIKQLKKRGHGRGIAIGVRTTGCSGLAYTLEYIDRIDPDFVGETRLFDKFIVQIDARSAVYFQDLVVDYVRQGLNEGFEFRNSAEKDRCGCGESFRV